MTMIKRVLGLAAPVALALFVAPSALAISPISEFKCLFPQSAAADLTNGVANSGWFTGNLEEKDCKNLCKELDKLCKKNAKEREKCIKTDDKAFFKADKQFCKIDFPDNKDDRKACENDVKDAEKACKDDLKQFKEDGKTNCEETWGKNSDCEANCDLSNFPFTD